jgi:hypothetical protein
MTLAVGGQEINVRSLARLPDLTPGLHVALSLLSPSVEHEADNDSNQRSNGPDQSRDYGQR